MQLRVLDGHADLIGDRHQKVKVILLEPASAVLRIDLEDAHRPLLLIENRHAHQGTDPIVTAAVATAKLGGQVLAQNGLSLVQNCAEGLTC